MYKPSLDGSGPDAWSSTIGSLDVHYSSGLMNRCFYFLSQGATTTGNTSTTTAYDTVKVQVLNTSGTVLATLATYSNLDKSTGYVQKSLSLSAYKGQTIRLRFYSVEDSSLQTSFVIDDVSVK